MRLTLETVIEQRQTVLDPLDSVLWKIAGIPVDDVTGSFAPLPVNSDETMCNALVWLASKIINFITSGDSVDHVFPQDPTKPFGLVGIAHVVLLRRWHEIYDELNAWYDARPESFKPNKRLGPITDGSIPADSPRALFPEICYDTPRCASTMQLYHMIAAIWETNTPHESTVRQSTVTERLESYRTIVKRCSEHSHWICGIAMGYNASMSNSNDSVRVYAIQPLFVAGQVLTATNERRVVLDLLKGIQRDLGISTDYRVRLLMQQWGPNIGLNV